MINQSVGDQKERLENLPLASVQEPLKPVPSLERAVFLHVDKATYLGGYRVRLEFSDGSRGEVDLSGELGRGVFIPLQDPVYFQSFTLSSHTLSWANGADFAPEFLHRLMLSQKEAVGYL